MNENGQQAQAADTTITDTKQHTDMQADQQVIIDKNGQHVSGTRRKTTHIEEHIDQEKTAQAALSLAAYESPTGARQLLNMIVRALVIVFVLDAVAIVASAFITGPDAAHLQILVTVFMTILGFLTGLVMPSPAK